MFNNIENHIFSEFIDGGKKNNLFVLEGVDGVGKTSVLRELTNGEIGSRFSNNELSEKIRKPLASSIDFPNDRALELLMNLYSARDILNSSSHILVLDRYIVSLILVHKALLNGTLDILNDLSFVNLLFSLPKPRATIFLTCNERVLSERILDRKQSKLDNDFIVQKLLNLYYYQLISEGYFYVIDTTGRSVEDITCEVNEFLYSSLT